MPLTADNPYYLNETGAIRFASSLTKIWCPVYVSKDDAITIQVQVWNTAGDTFYGEEVLTRTESELEAQEGAGTGEFTQFKSVVEQEVKDYLEGVSLNSGVTFTIV
jgi:hypothetical protein